MTDSDEEEPTYGIDLVSRPRRFAPQLLVAMAASCASDIFGSIGETFENIAVLVISHEKWRDQNADLGRAIESLQDVTPFQ